ncbi:MAG TPA: hypothetical protein PKH77_22920 [Anaerolineae bacterium]|nr:hypothetical protein [Anaerolineae bacterium]
MTKKSLIQSITSRPASSEGGRPGDQTMTWQVSTPAMLAVTQPATIPVLTRPELLTWLYTAPARRSDTTLAADLDTGLVTILVAHTLQYPVTWAEPMGQVGRFVQAAYQQRDYPDPDLIVALTTDTTAFQAAMRRFQMVRLKPHRGWGKWYQAIMAAARDLVAPLQALRPTADEARFVLRWAALVAATGSQYGVVE